MSGAGAPCDGCLSRPFSPPPPRLQPRTPERPDASRSCVGVMTACGMCSLSPKPALAIKPTAFHSRYRAVESPQAGLPTYPAASAAAVVSPSGSRPAARSRLATAGWVPASARAAGSAEDPREFAAAAGRPRGGRGWELPIKRKWPAGRSDGPFFFSIKLPNWIPIRISAAPEPSPPDGLRNGRPARPLRFPRRRS
jgi:hypothetical protein